jgi:hypothetical protein
MTHVKEAGHLTTIVERHAMQSSRLNARLAMAKTLDVFRMVHPPWLGKIIQTYYNKLP